jgi:hypothetical protein
MELYGKPAALDLNAAGRGEIRPLNGQLKNCLIYVDSQGVMRLLEYNMSGFNDYFEPMNDAIKLGTKCFCGLARRP